MGHRLIAFYTEALPRHKDYRSIDSSISNLREKSINDLDWIRKRLDVISLRIDEQQLNRHIQQQESDCGETSRTSVQESSENDTTDDMESQWESFSGWSSSDFGSNQASLRPNAAIESGAPRHQETTTTTQRRISLKPGHADDPGDIIDLDSDDDETSDVESSEGDSLSDLDSDERAVHVVFSEEEEGYDSSFLKVIASEEVEYEEDSEAVDSWAQDDESLESLAEHAPVAARPTINYSEAEMLGNLLNKVTQESYSWKNETSKNDSASSDGAPDDEAENVDPATSFCSVSKDTTANTLVSYPSFDEPPDDENDGITSSPQDVMNFEAHTTNSQRSPEKNTSVSFSEEEIVPIFLPGLRI